LKAGPYLLLLAAAFLTGCKDATRNESATKPLGSQNTHIELWYGGTWNKPFSADVSWNGYVVVRSPDCRSEKDPRTTGQDAEGICVARITDDDFKRIEGAVEPFRRSAIPLSSYRVDAGASRPDGKPCRDRAIDLPLISFTWTRTDGSEIASFDTGCDVAEFRNLYRAALALRRLLPTATQLERPANEH
jgi:hypothetical protein